MSRKKATICYIIFIIVVGFLFMKFSGRYFTPEQVLHANELGLHYGPSEKVLLKYKGKDSNMLVIGKVDDRTLSVIPVKRSLFVLWKLESGGIPGCVPMRYEDDRVVGNYSSNYEVVYGLTDLENAERVKFYVEHKNNDMPDFEKRGIYEADVDEDGFFYMPLEKVDEESWYYVIEMAVYDENGRELYKTEW